MADILKMTVVFCLAIVLMLIASNYTKSRDKVQSNTDRRIYQDIEEIPDNLIVIPKTEDDTERIAKIVTPNNKEMGLRLFNEMDTYILMSDGKGEYEVSIGVERYNGEFTLTDRYNVDCTVGKTEENMYLNRSYTVDFMASDELYDEIHRLVEEISLKGKEDTEEYARKAAKWVYDNTEYDDRLASEVVSGEDKEHNYKNVDIHLKRGICTDFAKKYAALMRVAGIPCKYITGKHNKSSHAWNEIYINNEWITVDCVSNKYGGDTTGYEVEFTW